MKCCWLLVGIFIVLITEDYFQQVQAGSLFKEEYNILLTEGDNHNIQKRSKCVREGGECDMEEDNCCSPSKYECIHSPTRDESICEKIEVDQYYDENAKE